MAAIGGSPGDSRRAVASPRPNKGRDYNPKGNILCRNVTIYGHCRHEHNGCVFQHDPSKITGAQAENVKKRFNVDSPSFTPLQPSTNGVTSSPRQTTISPKAANAAIFTPKSSVKASLAVHAKETTPEWHAHDFQEFVPQGYDVQGDSAVQAAALNPYDTFAASSAMGGMSPANHPAQLNPYSQDPSAMGGAAFFQNTAGFTQPIQYHLYAPMGPHSENLLAYQKTTHDFFIPDHLREDLQRKSEATRQILPNSSLPSAVDHFHSLVPLDTNNQKNASLFGYPTWVYKAVSSKDGLTYTLRRLEGYRLTSEQAIFSVRPWKRIDNGSIVAIHDAFTTRAFGDSSLIFVTDYHPLSKTLSEQHLNVAPRGYHNRANPHTVPEAVIWGYVVQIASALKAIHGNNLAARLIHPSKILVTSKNRIRLNSCAILDLLNFDNNRAIQELQQEDFQQLGRLVITIASNNSINPVNVQKALDILSRSYSKDLIDCVSWLLSPAPAAPGIQTPGVPSKDITTFIRSISDKMTILLDNTFHAEDTLTSNLGRELENGRLVRLVAKLNFINERPEFESNPQWSETGERYYLKLFRDYVFHQVDGNGHPVVDLGHVISCLNKLDVGSDEKISLVSRDEQNVLVVSYREVKRGVEQTFNELVKPKRR
ncbi:PAB-dependent poly(A)-specific ribonuclease subunit 3 [Neofusicoccum ribis]|uniref:PAN2-PAN3 deadenylation complex subunit PAN3 n=1 Tax=Neofusicoccum ribis TaxID=45134 RepID=A0ABR3TE74_9PEZI